MSFLFFLSIIFSSQTNAQLRPNTVTDNIFSEEQETSLIPRISLSGIYFDLRLSDKDKSNPCDLFKLSNFPNNWFILGYWNSSFVCPQHQKIISLFSSAQRNNLTEKLDEDKISIFKKKVVLREKQVDLNVFLKEINKYLEAPFSLSRISQLLSSNQAIKNSISYLLAEAAVQRKLGNRGGMYRNFYKILETPKQLFVINNEVFSKDSDPKDSEQELFKIIMFLKDSAFTDNEFLYLSLYLEGVLPEDLSSRLESNISLNDLREEVSSYKGGVRFPYIWINELQRRSTAKELRIYFEKVFKFIRNKRDLNRKAEILKYYLPPQKDKRSIILDYVRDLISNNSIYSKYVLVTILENADLVGLLDRNNIKVPPLFVLKRKFYIRLLEREFAINYALHRLLVLGDRSEDLIWWKIL